MNRIEQDKVIPNRKIVVRLSQAVEDQPGGTAKEIGKNE